MKISNTVLSFFLIASVSSQLRSENASSSNTPASPATSPIQLTPVIITASPGTILDESDLAPRRNATSDTSTLLRDLPGLSLYQAGGVSSLPALHGLADDRVLVLVDGLPSTSACANHMNPPLSYIDPANVQSVQIFAGIVPVSVGGDSIGGTIQVNSAPPEFAQAGEPTLKKAQAGVFYRSNGNAKGANLAASVAKGPAPLYIHFVSPKYYRLSVHDQ